MAKNVKISKEPIETIITNIEDFGKHIKFKRTSAGLSIEDASSLCNINPRTLTKLEKGSEGTRLSTALHIAKMFGLKMELS